jgi:hypothetical protein
MLIDDGETNEGFALVGKLRRLSVQQIDWMCASACWRRATRRC